jgi:hypothetical protein
VSEELWQKAQDCLRGKNKTMPKKLTNESFPLRGLVKCGHCAKLTSGNVRGRSKIYPKYWCANEACTHRVSVSVEKLEADWLEFLERMQPAFDALVNVLPMLAKAKSRSDGFSGIIRGFAAKRSSKRTGIVEWWAWVDLNHRPRSYQY